VQTGVAVIEVPAAYISTSCPHCGRVDPASHNFRTGVFHCTAPDCDFERKADWVAAYNMLTAYRPEKDTPLHDAVRHAAELARRLREKAHEETEDEGSDKAAE